ncbi:hypothetical protein CFC21_024030 [Triticum aestivum]|uniref:Pentatricopeptide repeat-containing protein n=3 Tax=Triticum TaxID=4564 RepID=A0A9R1PRV2_TRITD|nr:pentatricopeptide repeat-containing protein At4g26680, mitochondrial-like [Triticum aestivum]KAF7009504.1 hypothetical protein CFC21_024030 [Triticum aestivum]VAH48514.1 unnamed protein product [Triticum turgidum subsp. durum]
MRPPRALPLPHFTLPPLAGEDLAFVTALRSHLSSSPELAPSSLSRFLPQLNPLRLSHLLLSPPRVAHDLLGSLLSSPPPPLPFALLLHAITPRRSSELLASLLPSVSHHAFPELLHHLILTARLAAGSRGTGAAVPAVDVLFSACARRNKLSQATLTFRAMRAHGLLPRVESCNVFISAALRLKRPEIAVSFFREMRRCCISPNMYTANMVLRAFCALGRVADAATVLDEMADWGVDRTVVSFNTLIAAYCREHGGLEHALELKKKMELEGLAPSEVTYNTILHVLCKEGRMQQANRLLSEMKVKRVVPNTVTYNTLIYGYVMHGDNGTARRVHEGMVKNGVELDIITYNALILGLCRDGKIKKAVHLFQQLDRSKLEPNASTFSALILGYCMTQNSERALQLLKVMKKSGFHPNYDTYKIVISAFCKNKDFEGAVDVMKELLEMCMAPDKVLLHEFFEALSKAKKLHLAEDLWSADKGGKFIPSIYYTGDYRNNGEEKTAC